MQGTIDDADIRRVLTYVIDHPQRFSSGVRLDSLDALRTRISDPGIRHALCQAARHDENPAVRLKALEALNRVGSDPDALHTMVAALSSDDNSGVRVEAVNALLAALGSADAGAIPLDPDAQSVLQDRMQNDPNYYIRQRSATALAHLASLDNVQRDAGRIDP
jgi:HEAT repeat protein